MGARRRSRRRHSTDATSLMVYVGLGAVAIVTVVLVVAALQPRTPSVVSTPRPWTSIDPVVETDDRTAALFIGDSYTAGAGASDTSKRWTTLVANQQDWYELNEALGGTGYISASDERGCGKEYCEPYPELVGTLTSAAPDQIIVNGGRNDPADLDAFRAGVDATFTALEERFPEIPIAVTLPLGDDDTPATALEAKAAIVTEVANAHGVRVIDLGQPLLGHPDYVTDDSVHPNDAGHQAIADAFNAAW